MQQMVPEFKGLSLADVLGNVQALKAGQLRLDDAQRKQEASQRIRDIYASGQDMTGPEGQRQLMAVDPEYGLKMADLQARLNKSRAEVSNDDMEFFTKAAAGIASQLDSLPEAERTDDNLHRIRDQYAAMVETVDPARAAKLRAGPLDRNAMYALARSAAKYGGGGDEYYAQFPDAEGNLYQARKSGGPPVPLGIKGPIHYGIFNTDQGVYRAPTNRSDPAQPLSAGGGISGGIGGEPPKLNAQPLMPYGHSAKQAEQERQKTTADFDAWKRQHPTVESDQKRLNESSAAYRNLLGAINTLESKLAEHGTQLRAGPFTPAAAKELGQAYQALLWQMRAPEMANTGVLNPGEMPMLEQSVGDPTNWQNYAQLEGIKRQLAGLRDTGTRNYGNVLQEFGKSAYFPPDEGGTAPAQQPAKLRKYNSKGEAVEWDGKEWVKVQP